MSTQIPTPSTITAAQVSHLLSLYQSTLEAVYKSNSRLKDPKKLSNALEDDVWRYESLPRTIQERTDSGAVNNLSAYLEKPELERLVQWKITHGSYRPTLPSLIRQNDAELVKSTTRKAFRNKNGFENRTCPTWGPPAFTILVQDLKGVGPATATLILHLQAPENLPFFSDELYAWLVEPGKMVADLKLKYTKTEYQQLATEWNTFSHRYQTFGKVNAIEIEKVAYVLAKWDLVSAEDKDKFQKAATEGRTVGSQGALGRLRKEKEEQGKLADGRKKMLDNFASLNPCKKHLKEHIDLAKRVHPAIGDYDPTAPKPEIGKQEQKELARAKRSNDLLDSAMVKIGSKNFIDTAGNKKRLKEAQADVEEAAESQSTENRPTQKEEEDSKPEDPEPKSETEKDTQSTTAPKGRPTAKGRGSIPKPAPSRKKAGPKSIIKPGPNTEKKRKELHASMEESGNRRSKRLRKE